MRILVTGGQGFLGGALVRALVEAGYTDVTATARRDAPELEALGVTVATLDLRDRDAVFKVTEGIDVVFHTAAKAGIWGDFQEYYTINVEATQHLLDGAKANKVPYFVHTSSPSVTFAGHCEIDVDESTPYSSTPLNPYCFTKIQAEKAVLGADQPLAMRTLALRPHLIYGPGDPHLLPRVFEAASRGRLIQVGDGLNRVDVTHINDTVAAHLAVLSRLDSDEVWGRPYFITSGKPILLWDWLTSLLAWKGTPVRKRALSLRSAVLLGSALEWLYRLFRLQSEPRLTKFSALQLGCSHTYSIESAQRLLGYCPQVDPYSDFDAQFPSSQP